MLLQNVTKVITKCVRFFIITKCDNFIVICASYYKMRRFYYKMRQLLQNASFMSREKKKIEKQENVLLDPRQRLFNHLNNLL